MKKPQKRHVLLNLAVLALNEAIRKGLVDLNGKSEEDFHSRKHQYLVTAVGGKNTVINWFDIGYDELRISVWWDYHHAMHPEKDQEEFITSMPLAKRHSYKDFLGACVSCWLERKTGKYIMGEDGDRLFSMYVRSSSENALAALPAETPLGFQTGGPFHL